MYELERIAQQIADILEGIMDEENIGRARRRREREVPSDPLSDMPAKKTRVEGTGISPGRLPDIVNEAIGGHDNFNCYPGVPGAKCHDLAVFISIQGSASKSHGRRMQGHLAFETALHKIVQHMQGYCHGHTSHALFFTDSWDPDTFQEWRSNLIQIRKNSHVGIYLWAAGKVNPVF